MREVRERRVEWKGEVEEDLAVEEGRVSNDDLSRERVKIENGSHPRE